MISEPGFLFSIAGVSMTLASLAGLVVAFRRTGTWRAHDLYRLRQIVEWGFSNTLMSLAGFPLASAYGSEALALRTVATIALAFTVANFFVLEWRRRAARSFIRLTAPIVMIDLALLASEVTTLALGTMAAWEFTLVLLVMRPMGAFIYVIASLGREDPSS